MDRHYHIAGKQIYPLVLATMLVFFVLLVLSTARAVAAQGHEYELSFAASQPWAEIELIGDGQTQVLLKIKSSVGFRLVVNAGTYLANSNGSAQPMVVTRTQRFRIRPSVDPLEFELEVVCADFDKKVPDSSSRFRVRLSPHPQLTRLLRCIQKEAEDANLNSSQIQGLVQLATWVVTNDVSLEELKKGTSFKLIDANKIPELINLLRLIFDDCGIDISGKRLFQEG